MVPTYKPFNGLTDKGSEAQRRSPVGRKIIGYDGGFNSWPNCNDRLTDPYQKHYVDNAELNSLSVGFCALF